jgi:phosphoribosylanthranilate isomerase
MMKVKICGITNIDDARHAVGCGADLLGFVFFPKSPRYVTPEAAAAIIGELPTTVEKVGVFVDETNAAMADIARACGLTRIQMHGSESPGQVADMQEFEVFKAVALQQTEDLVQLETYAGCTFLVDTPGPGYGGTGKTGDWQLASAAAASQRIFLAGGLTPVNVANAISAVQPYGVDVSSGVERAEGQKDHDQVAAFITAAKASTEVH